MALNQKHKTTEFFTIPEDNYIITLYSVIDLGLQEVEFQGETKIQPKVFLTFELQDCSIPDGRPAVISKEYTASLHEKSQLRPVVVALHGGGEMINNRIEIDNEELSVLLKEALGKSVLGSVVHKKSSKGNTYANLGSVLKLSERDKKNVKNPVNPTVFIDDIDTVTDEQLKAVPKWILEKKLNKKVVAPVNLEDNDDIPF